VLIVQTKTIIIARQQVKVFSLDGKLWVSRPSDLKEFKSRRTHEKVICQKGFSERAWTNRLPIANSATDYWP